MECQQYEAIAIKKARRFAAQSPEPFDDLAQVARIAIWNSLPKYDGDRGVPIGAYLNQKVDFALRSYIRENFGCRFKIPKNVVDQFTSITHSYAELRKTIPSITVEEIAAAAGLSPEKWFQVRTAIASRAVELIDEIDSAIDSDRIDADLAQDVTDEMLWEAIASLSPIERSLLLQHYFSDVPIKTLAKRLANSPVNWADVVDAKTTEEAVELILAMAIANLNSIFEKVNES